MPLIICITSVKPTRYKFTPSHGNISSHRREIGPDRVADRGRAGALEDVLVVRDGEVVVAIEVLRDFLGSPSDGTTLEHTLRGPHDILRGPPLVAQEDPLHEPAVCFVDVLLAGL